MVTRFNRQTFSVNQTRGKWNISQFPTGIIDIKNFYVNQFSRSDLWKCLLWPTAGAGEMRCTFPTITPKNTLQIASLVNVSFDFLSWALITFRSCVRKQVNRFVSFKEFQRQGKLNYFLLDQLTK